jgi:hypothetical protein
MTHFIGLVWDIWIWLAMIGAGMYTIWKGIFPPTPKEDPDFYSESAEVWGPGFQKTLYSDMLEPAKARLIAILFGSMFVIGGVLGILHYMKLPPFSDSTPSF